MMQKKSAIISAIITSLLIMFVNQIGAQKLKSLTSKHYSVYYEKEHEQIAGEVLHVAETVWPTLAKAYDAYDNYKPIDIFVVDRGDFANGNAIYTFARVFIFIPHLDWVMRGRRNWIANVVTHELAHVFSLRKAAYLAAFDHVLIAGGTFNKEINYSLTIPWVPLVAPSWYIEGIAQLESEEHGYDVWDSQRDMIIRDAYLTNTLPSLGEIETFDGDWIAGERVYNTGFAFLRFLRNKFGIEKVRKLAYKKAVFNFSSAVYNALGTSLSKLYEEWKVSLKDQYQKFEHLKSDHLYASKGSYNHSLAFSPNGIYVAWIGNDHRDAPMNWIYWAERKSENVHKAKASFTENTFAHSFNNFTGSTYRSKYGIWDQGTNGPHPIIKDVLKDARFHECHIGSGKRSKKFGSSGLEFNKSSDRLLTTRRSKHSPYRDIWEYDFKRDKWHRKTWNERAYYARYHANKKLIVFSRHGNGSSNIAILDSTGVIYQLTNFKNGEQVYSPRFTPKGDSVYFTLGIDDKEAIVAISARSPGYDLFATLEDFAVFPDSNIVAIKETLRFVTQLDENLDRDLWFSGDTLFWSSYNDDKVYNIYARVPGDSVIYRATQVKGQALEPIVNQGALYYQGYKKQGFHIFKQQVQLSPTSFTLGEQQTGYYLPKHEKKREYAKVFKPGEYGGKRVAWEIAPRIGLSPRFISGDIFSTGLSLGLALSIGDLTSSVSHYLEANIGKELEVETPLDYTLIYSGSLNKPAIRHIKFAWLPQIHYSLARFVIHQVFEEPRTRLTPLVFNGQIATDILTGNDIYYDSTYTFTSKQTYDVMSTWMQLPFNFYLNQRFLRIGEDDIIEIYKRFFSQTNAVDYKKIFNDQQYDQFFENVQTHKHFLQRMGWSWNKFKAGTRYPTGVVLSLSAAKIWATYPEQPFALDNDSSLVDCARNNEVCGNLVLEQKKFSPWNINAWLGGVYSWEKIFTSVLLSEMGAYSKRFPTDYFSPYDPHSNLYPLFYRLGVFRMPGYNYNFSFHGRDILKGTAMFWTRGILDIPLKQYLFFDSDFLPFTSLNQIKLSLMGNAGATLNEMPANINRSIQDGKSEMIFDVGARFSLNFQMFHWLPMTLYFQAFQPVNRLKIEELNPLFDFPVFDDNNNGNMDAQEVKRYRTLFKNTFEQAVKEPKFFIGLDLGRF